MIKSSMQLQGTAHGSPRFGYLIICIVKQVLLSMLPCGNTSRSIYCEWKDHSYAELLL